jgi:hypothetical protein
MTNIDPRWLLFWGFGLCWFLDAVSVELLKYAKLSRSKALLGLTTHLASFGQGVIFVYLLFSLR